MYVWLCCGCAVAVLWLCCDSALSPGAFLGCWSYSLWNFGAFLHFFAIRIFRYFYFGPGSDSYGRYEHQPRSGYGGGGYSFYYLMSVMMLASYIRRMGSTPNGWDLGQFWHSLQNIDFWQGMMYATSTSI